MTPTEEIQMIPITDIATQSLAVDLTGRKHKEEYDVLYQAALCRVFGIVKTYRQQPITTNNN